LGNVDEKQKRPQVPQPSRRTNLKFQQKKERGKKSKEKKRKKGNSPGGKKRTRRRVQRIQASFCKEGGNLGPLKKKVKTGDPTAFPKKKKKKSREKGKMAGRRRPPQSIWTNISRGGGENTTRSDIKETGKIQEGKNLRSERQETEKSREKGEVKSRDETRKEDKKDSRFAPSSLEATTLKTEFTRRALSRNFPKRKNWNDLKEGSKSKAKKQTLGSWGPGLLPNAAPSKKEEENLKKKKGKTRGPRTGGRGERGLDQLPNNCTQSNSEKKNQSHGRRGIEVRTGEESKKGKACEQGDKRKRSVGQNTKFKATDKRGGKERKCKKFILRHPNRKEGGLGGIYSKGDTSNPQQWKKN